MANYFYNKAIIHEFNNTPFLIPVTITDNTVKCKDKTVAEDIENKIADMKINHVIFYVSLYDYELLNETKYYENVLAYLPPCEYPIYKRDTDIGEFFKWYEENFNNNKTDVYESGKFTKREKVFDNNTTCTKSVVYAITNKKFHNFNQLFYHAGDDADLQRFGLLYCRSIFKYKMVEEIPNPDCVFSVTPPKIIVTLDYLFNYMKKGILVGIKSNKLAIFLPFSKHNYENDYYDELYFNEEDKKNLRSYKKGNLDRRALFKAVYDFYNKNGIRTNGINPDRTKWVANDCFFRNEFYEGDKNEALYENLFSTLCRERVVPDCIFFLNLRDHPMLRKDRKHPYTSITDADLPAQFVDANFAPILSIGSSTEYEDIAMVTQDDWLRITQRFFPDDCKNGYIAKDGNTDITTSWKDKIPMAIFRGSATGCGMTVETNMRIKACDLSLQFPNLLDAGLTSYNRKIKKELGKPIAIADTHELKKYSKQFINNAYKSTFKYVLTIDGHVSAFRLGYEFSLKSVLLLPVSTFYIWLSHFLEPYVHYVPVASDLSDLIDVINWCKNNDKKCEAIAQNGYDLYVKKLGRDGALDYMQEQLSKIKLYAIPPVVNAKICIIVPYRDDVKHERLQQKRLFLYFMNKLLENYCGNDEQFAIIVVEQVSGEKFNIGKLKNVGFDYMEKKGLIFDNYVFSDIDMLPDDALIEYYFKVTDGMNSLAKRGTRYDTKNSPFMGGVIACTGDVFRKINGFANSFSRGLGGEDDNLIVRCVLENVTNFLPKVGAVMDLEDKTLNEKIVEIKRDGDKLKWEFASKYGFYKEDGLSNLEYDLVDDFSEHGEYHIVVDLLQKEYEEKNKELFDVSGFKMEDYEEFKKVKNRIKQREY
jgi:hypothetical protein